MTRVLCPTWSLVDLFSVPVHFARPTGEHIRTVFEEDGQTTLQTGEFGSIIPSFAWTVTKDMMDFFRDPILNLWVSSKEVHHPHEAMGCSVVAGKVEDEHCRYQLKRTL